jgi:uncharacterized membrane protein YdjX (TVP38/TMEM64 family)
MAKGPAASGLDNEEGTLQIRKGHWRFAPIGVVVAGLAFGYAMGWQECLSLEYLGDSREALKRFGAANPVLAPVGFVLLYAVAVAFSFPAASILTIISGFLFGWFAGAIYAILAATTGATALFLAARTAFGGFLKERAGSTAGKLACGFEKDAFGYLLALRIAPFIPFFVVNIAPALFNVRLKTFLAATLIGILPGAFAYAWLGQGLDSVLMAARAAGRDATVSDLVTPEITIAFVVLALVAALATIVRKVWAPRAS